MASKITETENQVKCPKCSGDLKNPTLLACRHILCNICINELDPNDSQENYKCLVCQSVTPKTQAKYLAVIQELLEFIETVGSKDCDNCKHNPCEWRCKECKFSFCTECRRNHDSLEVLKNHAWSKIQDAQPVFENCMFCETHPNELIRIYCINKHKLGCALCATKPDQDNDFRRLEDAVETVIPAIKENQMKLENEIQTAEKHLAENEATAEEIKDAYEKIEEQMKSQYKDLLEKNETNYEKQQQQAEEKYEDDLKEAKRNYEDSLKHAEEYHEEVKIKAEQEHNNLIEDLNKTKQDQISVIEQDNCSLELEIRSEKSVVGLCETSLSVAQGATLLNVMRSGLSTSLELHLQRRPIYKKYSNLPNAFFDATEVHLPAEGSAESNLVGKLYSHSTFIQRPLKEINKLSSKLVKTIQTDISCNRFDLIHNQLWCADTASNEIHIFSLNGDKIKSIKIEDAGSCSSAVQVKEYGVAVAAAKGLFLLNTDGEIIQKILTGAFCDVSVIGDNMYALEDKKGSVYVLQETGDAYIKFKEFHVEDCQTCYANTIQTTPKHVYIGLFAQNHIQQYSHTGDLKATYKGNQVSAVGRLNKPRICGADASGTILIADYRNHRLVTLTPEGELAPLKLHGLSSKPNSAVVFNNNLYVYCWSDKSIQIFSLD